VKAGLAGEKPGEVGAKPGLVPPPPKAGEAGEYPDAGEKLGELGLVPNGLLGE